MHSFMALEFGASFQGVRKSRRFSVVCVLHLLTQESKMLVLMGACMVICVSGLFTLLHYLDSYF